MSTATASANVGDAGDEVREGLREVRDTAADVSAEIQRDLQKLREDFSRLAAQVTGIVTDIAADKGSAAWRRARSGVDSVMADAQDKGREAVGAVRDVSSNFVEAIDESIAKRPYATLALAAAVGFIVGAAWRR